MERYGATNPGQIPAYNRGRRNNMRAVLLSRHPGIKNVDEYMGLLAGDTIWLEEFANINGRRATYQDLKAYFGLIPRRLKPHQKDLLRIGKNYYELRVKEYLDGLSLPVAYVHRTRPIKVTEESPLYKPELAGKPRSNVMEIDIYLPEWKLGIEINEFATHSKDSDTEPFRKKNGSVKKGPIYHSEKQRLASQQCIELHFLWEDEFRDDSYQKHLNQILKNRTTQLIT